MGNQVIIKAVKRAVGGSGEARRVRRAGKIPAALGLLSRETEPIQIDAYEYMMATRNQMGEQIVVRLELEGKSFNALIREVQHDVLTSRPSHVDLSELDMTKMMRAAVYIELKGEPVGVRNDGGVLAQTLHVVEIECLPTDFIESVALDVAAMNIGDSLTVADLKLGDSYTVITDAEQVIASVVIPATEEEAPAASEEAAADDADGDEEQESK